MAVSAVNYKRIKRKNMSKKRQTSVATVKKIISWTD